jgi:uncharacterized protein (DUF2147 family)
MIVSRFACVLLSLSLSMLLLAPSVDARVPTPVGIWLHENGRFKLEIAPCGDELCGKLVWFRWPNDAQGLPLVDLKNPDSALRTRPLLGLTVLTGLRRVADGKWEDGEIYNPDDGEEYKVQITIQGDGSLRARVYKFLPIFGETLIWKHVD